MAGWRQRHKQENVVGNKDRKGKLDEKWTKGWRTNVENGMKSRAPKEYRKKLRN